MSSLARAVRCTGPVLTAPDPDGAPQILECSAEAKRAYPAGHGLLVHLTLRQVGGQHTLGLSELVAYEPPAGAPRPQNTQLDPSSLWAAVGSEVNFTPLRDGLAKALEAHKSSFASVD